MKKFEKIKGTQKKSVQPTWPSALSLALQCSIFQDFQLQLSKKLSILISHFLFHTFNYEIGIDNFDDCGYKSWKIEHCKASNNADGHVGCPDFF